MKEHSDIDWSFKSFVDPNIPLKAKIVAIMTFTSLPFVFGGMVLMFGVMMLTLPFVLVKDLIFSLTVVLSSVRHLLCNSRVRFNRDKYGTEGYFSAIYVH